MARSVQEPADIPSLGGPWGWMLMPARGTRPAAARPPDARGERLTRRVVTCGIVLVGTTAFLFSLGNSHELCRYFRVDEPWAWLIAPTVDVVVITLFIGLRYLALRG